ncbi:subunit of tubulin prefoldin [Agyrium rufum]|nr:subunit of tubulin prefoldin [Agyrium rufum]
MSAGNQGQKAVDLAGLSIEQLKAVKKQLDDELEHLMNSFSKLKAAQAKFQDCQKSIQDGVKSQQQDRDLLVPMTTSLYVPGKLADPDHVIVDVGTGFYVEKSPDEGITFYKERSEDLAKNLRDLESIVQGKSNNSRVIEDALRRKVISDGGTGA